MISKAEALVLKEQIDQLRHDNEKMSHKIHTLQDSNQQIIQIKKNIRKLQTERTLHENEYMKTIESLNSQLSEKVDIKATARTISLNSILGFSDDIQYNNLKSKLDTEADRLSALADEEAKMAESLEQVAMREQMLSTSIQDLTNFVKQLEVFRPQIETCLGSGLYIQDLCTRLEALKIQRSVQKGRRFRLKNWIQQTKAVHESQMLIFHGLENDIVNLGEKHKLLESEFHGTEIRLRNETTKCNQEEFNILEETNRIEKYRSETDALVKKARADLEKMGGSISEVDDQASHIQSEIGLHGLKKKKLLQKKLEMIQQLRKRIIVERKSLQKQDISSPVVVELTEVEESHLLEKEAMLKVIKKHEDKLKWLQADAEKKTQIIRELEVSVVPMDEPVSEKYCLKMFERTVEEVKTTNAALLNDLQTIGIELAGIEGENQSLHTIIKSLE